MPVYKYKALNDRGKVVAGMLDTETPLLLRAELRKKALFLSEYAEQTKGGAVKKRVGATGTLTAGSREVNIGIFNRVNLLLIAEMTQQMAILLRSGIPLVDSLGALVEQTEHLVLKTVLTQVRKDVNEGSQLQAALRQHPRVFSNLYCNMVGAGEASGNLDLVFERMTELIRSQVQLRSRVRSAMTYPAVVLSIAFLVVALLMTFVVPQMLGVLTSGGKDLPTSTRFLMWISNLFETYWWVMILGTGATISLFTYWIKTPKGRVNWHRFALKLPVVGALIRKVAIARFARTLATLLGSSVPLLDAMEISKSVVGNAIYEQALDDARVAIRDGESIAAPLVRSGVFPPMVTKMITTGEKTGQVEVMLGHVANAYEEQVDATVSRLTSLLEPFIIVVLGLIVGFIVFAVISPMIDFKDVIKPT
jgi:general secretion pathway protein F